MLVAVSLLAISLSILIYHHPPSTWKTLLSPVGNAASSAGSEKALQNGSPEKRAPAKQQQSEPQIQVKHKIEDTSTLDPSPQTTPKAIPSATQNGVPVPTFSLADRETSDEEEDDLPPPSFPALNSAQRASAKPQPMALPPQPSLMAPPPKPPTMAPPSLMPPPQIVPSNLRALPTPSNSLRVPTTGPLPNRGPTPNRATNSSSSLGLPPASGPTPKPQNARNKVLLKPGHSPLDWANLQRSGKNLSGVPSLLRVPPSLLKTQNGRKGKPAWSSYQGKVYNITPYLPFHPGGEGELRRAAGKDGGKLFMEVHPWVNWENMLGECLVGIMVSEEQAVGGSLEDIE